MNDFKGSETPWRKVFTIMGAKRAVRCGGYLICTLNPPQRFSGQDERYDNDLKICEADQNLIASAPELLEALQALLACAPSIEEIGSTTFDNHFVKAIRKSEAAINKALGKETQPC